MNSALQIRLHVALLAACLLAVPHAVRAQEDKSWVLDMNNWQLGERLLPAPVLARLKRGEYWFKVVPTDPAAWRSNVARKFWDASSANAGRYDVKADPCSLLEKATGKLPSFVVGLPFPTIDPADPVAGCKVAWNFDLTNGIDGGGGGDFLLSGIDSTGEFRRLRAFIDAASFQGRLDGPRAENPENLEVVALAGALEPQDAEGVSGLTKRFWESEKEDAIWAYVPSTRRVRRITAATNSDPVAGLDIFADDLNCYASKVEYYRWKLVGEAEVLAPVISATPFRMEPTDSPTRFKVITPYTRATYETGGTNAPWWIQDNLVFVPRPVWVVEGQAIDPYYNFGKVIMYFDKDIYRIYWKLVHNRAGEHFYTAMCTYHFVKQDETFSSIFPNVVMGVNEKLNRACLAGRSTVSFIERQWDLEHFSVQTLTQLSD